MIANLFNRFNGFKFSLDYGFGFLVSVKFVYGFVSFLNGSLFLLLREL